MAAVPAAIQIEQPRRVTGDPKLDGVIDTLSAVVDVLKADNDAAALAAIPLTADINRTRAAIIQRDRWTGPELDALACLGREAMTRAMLRPESFDDFGALVELLHEIDADPEVIVDRSSQPMRVEIHCICIADAMEYAASISAHSPRHGASIFRKARFDEHRARLMWSVEAFEEKVAA